MHFGTLVGKGGLLLSQLPPEKGPLRFHSSTMAFESAVEAALAATQRVLGANRKLALPADVHRE